MYLIKNLYEEHITIEELVRRLNNLTCSGVLSWYSVILHDSDIKENGEPKKNHFHCLIDSDSKSHHLKQDLKDKLDSIDIWVGCEKNQKQIESVRSVQRAVRYLTHKDNLEKYQYSDDKVLTSDEELYKEYIKLQIKAKEIDKMLNDLLDMALEKYEQGKEMQQGDILLYFKRLGRIDYYLKNSTKIKQMMWEYIQVMSEIPY